MIYIWAVAFIVLFGFGLLWYFVNVAVQIYIQEAVAVDSAIFENELVLAAHTLIVNVWMWLPVIMILTLLLWVYVNSQKPQVVYSS